MALKSTPTYSIIIPHYKLPFQLDRLLSTIPCNNKCQIIVVDDCSDVKTIEKLNKIKQKYPSIELYSTGKNGGGGKARNIGLSHAKGKYVIFADADDFFLPSFKYLLNRYQNEDFDILFYNAISLDDHSFKIKSRHQYLNNLISIAAKNYQCGIQQLKYLFGEPWCKIIKNEMIKSNKITFDETSIHNDTKFSYMCGFYAKKCIIDETAAYCITDREASVSKSISKEKLNIRFKTFLEKNIFLAKNNINIFDPIMLSPIKNALKKYDFSTLRNYLKLLNENDYSVFKLMFQITKNKFKLS